MIEIITSLLPTLLQLVGRALTAYDASQATLAAFDALVAGAKDDGLISKETKTVFLSQEAQVAAQLAADAKASQASAAPKV